MNVCPVRVRRRVIAITSAMALADAGGTQLPIASRQRLSDLPSSSNFSAG